MDIILGLFGILIFGAVVFILLNGVSSFTEKYLGMTLVSKYSNSQKRGVESSNKAAQFIVEMEQKANPTLVNLAINRIKEKNHAMTYQNIVNEIELIKKDKALMNLLTSSQPKKDPYQQITDLHNSMKKNL